jgi:DNA-directed RNA polymerase subunit K/omega
MPIKTIDVDRLAAQTGSLYEAIAILSKRSRQVASNLKAELDDKLSYFEGFGGEMEDVRMNEEQARVSIDYERGPKPTELAIEEMFNGEIYYRNPTEEQ